MAMICLLTLPPLHMSFKAQMIILVQYYTPMTKVLMFLLKREEQKVVYLQRRGA